LLFDSLLTLFPYLKTNFQLPDDLNSLGLREQDKEDLLAAIEEYDNLVTRYLDIERRHKEKAQHPMVYASADLIAIRKQLYEARLRVASAARKGFVTDREYLTVTYTCHWLTIILAGFQALNDISHAFRRAPSSPSPSSSASTSSSPSTSPSVPASPCTYSSCLPQYVR
jgi:hypothetical protein